VIFAIIDLTAYGLGLGWYSGARLVAAGLVHATPEAFQAGGFANLEAGDMIFWHQRGSCMSWAVMYFTNGPMSHTAMSLGGGEVLDATTAGVIVHPLRDYFNGSGYITAAKLPALPEHREKMRAFALEQVGKGFNWLGVFRLGGAIVLGGDEHFRAKFAVDVLLLLCGLGVVFYFVPILPVLLCAAAGMLYVLLVCYNVAQQRRRAPSQPAGNLTSVGHLEA
jgi:hypothetical protein